MLTLNSVSILKFLQFTFPKLFILLDTFLLSKSHFYFCIPSPLLIFQTDYIIVIFRIKFLKPMCKAVFLPVLPYYLKTISKHQCGSACHHFLETTLATCTINLATNKIINRVKQECPRNKRHAFVWKTLTFTCLASGFWCCGKEMNDFVFFMVIFHTFNGSHTSKWY